MVWGSGFRVGDLNQNLSLESSTLLTHNPKALNGPDQDPPSKLRKQRREHSRLPSLGAGSNPRRHRVLEGLDVR